MPSELVDVLIRIVERSGFGNTRTNKIKADMPGGLMSRLRFLNVKNILPAMVAVMLLILMACGGDGDAETTTTSTSSSSSSAAPKATAAPAAKAPAAAAKGKSKPTPVPPKAAPTAVPKTGPKAGGHIRMSAYADTKDWDPKGSSSLSSIMSYSQLYNQIVQMLSLIHI